ncbi:unnamed protein product [marine sediment metagenome]|uniref:B12-binding domain-containing protein n=1 Tax=marine sediment metagenome TaxID=412755 RepID=X1F4N3_9ZZZZ
MYLSSYLKQNNYSVNIIDLEVECESKLEHTLRESNCAIFGIGGATLLFPEVKRIARKIKSYDKNNIVIFGGPHATAVEKDVLRICSDIDIIVSGKGEETLKELLDYYYFRESNISKIQDQMSECRGLCC